MRVNGCAMNNAAARGAAATPATGAAGRQQVLEIHERQDQKRQRQQVIGVPQEVLLIERHREETGAHPTARRVRRIAFQPIHQDAIRAGKAKAPASPRPSIGATVEKRAASQGKRGVVRPEVELEILIVVERGLVMDAEHLRLQEVLRIVLHRRKPLRPDRPERQAQERLQRDQPRNVATLLLQTEPFASAALRRLRPRGTLLKLDSFLRRRPLCMPCLTHRISVTVSASAFSFRDAPRPVSVRIQEAGADFTSAQTASSHRRPR